MVAFSAATTDDDQQSRSAGWFGLKVVHGFVSGRQMGSLHDALDWISQPFSYDFAGCA